MADEIVYLPIGKLVAGEHATRLEFDDEAIDDLAASIRRIGIIVPLLVCSRGDSFIVIAGHRRLAAAKQVGLQSVPCIVREAEEPETKEVAIAENLFRADLTPVETACAVKDILDAKVMDLPELAKCMHRSEHWVARQLGLLAWPEDVLTAVHEGWLSVSAAENISLIHEDTYRAFLLKNARDGGATARTTASWLQAWRASAPPKAALASEPAPPGESVQPAVPMAPCICCAAVFRSDELSHVPMCPACIRAVREIGTRG